MLHSHILDAILKGVKNIQPYKDSALLLGDKNVETYTSYSIKLPKVFV